jgi:hypothetical protein
MKYIFGKPRLGIAAEGVQLSMSNIYNVEERRR